MEINEVFAKFDYYVGVFLYFLLSILLISVPFYIGFLDGNLIILTLSYVFALLIYWSMKWLFKYFKQFLIWKAKKLYGVTLFDKEVKNG